MLTRLRLCVNWRRALSPALQPSTLERAKYGVGVAGLGQQTEWFNTEVIKPMAGDFTARCLIKSSISRLLVYRVLTVRKHVGCTLFSRPAQQRAVRVAVAIAFQHHQRNAEGIQIEA